MAKPKYFTTSDGQEFYTENSAVRHAKSLKNRTVSPPGSKETVKQIEVDSELSISDVSAKAEEKVIKPNTYK
jgi:hypothetical protein